MNNKNISDNASRKSEKEEQQKKRPGLIQNLITVILTLYRIIVMSLNSRIINKEDIIEISKKEKIIEKNKKLTEEKEKKEK
jgi:hypothetical protein